MKSMNPTAEAGKALVTRRNALQMLGAGAAFVATGCGGSSKKTDDKSGGGFRLDALPWGIDNNGVALLESTEFFASGTGPDLSAMPRTRNLLFITPDGRPSPVKVRASGFAISRSGTAVYTENPLLNTQDISPQANSAVYLTRPNGVRQKVLDLSAVSEASFFDFCEISDRAEQVVVMARRYGRDPFTSVLLRGRVLSSSDDGSGGNFTVVATEHGLTPPPTEDDRSKFFREINSFAVNDAGEVAFSAGRADGAQAVYFVPVGGGGGTSVLLAVAGGVAGATYTDVLRIENTTTAVSINESGMVAFGVHRPGNRSAIIKWHRGVFTTVAESAEGEHYSRVSLNNAGGIAYTSLIGLNDSRPWLTKVAYLPSVAVSVEDGITFIASGDRLFGRKVIEPQLGGTRALNDRLEICLLYTSPSPRDS